MKILITGCNGFIAKHVIKKLNSQYEFIGVGRAEQSSVSGMPYVKADISNREELFANVKEQVKGVDIIIHAAAEISNDVEALYQANCLGTQNVVDLAKELHCKQFIYISSVPLIGFPIQIPVTENHPVNPSTIYHYTKYFGEMIVAQLEKENIQYLNFRISSPVGLEMPEGKIFSAFVRKSLQQEEIEIYGNGQRIQNYLDVRDLVYAVRKGLNSDCRGTYNIIGNSISDYDLAKSCVACFHSCGRIRIKNENIVGNTEKWILSGNKAKNDFDYAPCYSIEDSIEYVAEGMKG